MTRSQRDYPSREGLRERVAEDFGAAARILTVEEVLVGGLGGFFGTRRYRVTVETEPQPDISASRDALLALVDAAADGDRVALSTTPSPEPERPVVVLSELAGAAPAAAPPPSRGHPQPGDLVALVGVGPEVGELAARLGWGPPVVLDEEVLGADAEGHRAWRRGLVRRRADGVLERRPVLLLALVRPRRAAETARLIDEADADETVLVVDCSRKHDDTRRWVAEFRSALPPTGMLVVGAERTATPGTVDELLLPRVVLGADSTPQRLLWE